jgi:predicted nucleotidyltransferase
MADPGAQLAAAASALVSALDAFGQPSMVIGGIASIAHGVARLTRDIDATVQGEGTELEALVITMNAHDIVPRIDDAIEFARRHQVLLLRHGASKVDIDLSLAWLPFELESIAAAETVELQGVRLRIPRPEDLVIYKVVAWRPQDRQDIERLLALHGQRMDLDRVRGLVDEICTALDDSARAVEFDELIRRT